MKNANNNFLKSRMNKDLDARIIPTGEYRNALNAQISRSEGDNVGALEDVLGNIEETTFNTGEKAIGYFSDNSAGIIYVFATDYLDQNPNNFNYQPGNSSSIYAYNTLTSQTSVLVRGSFLNFSQTNPITGVNVLENLLFWTDNRNQPRKINTTTANNVPNYYTREEQISVAKNFPHKAIELWQESLLGTSATEKEYETTMYDVSSKFYPDGGEALTDGPVTASTSIIIDNVFGSIPVGSVVTGPDVVAGTTVVSFTLSTNTLVVSVAQTLLNNSELVFDANPYYESSFSGDPSYLEDRFVRFSYRFRYDDGEYSVMAPFTQIAFIPKQDGYFMERTAANSDLVENDEEAAYRTTIVEFVENKVDKISLRIPLEFTNTTIQNQLKLTEIDILYKESQQTAVKVVDTVPVLDVFNQSATCSVVGTPTATADILVSSIVGGIQNGSIVSGEDVVEGTTVVSFDQDTSTITLSSVQTLAAGTVLTIGEPSFYVYNYNSTKPYKTLPSSETIRVYDKIPVRALSQEVISNRIVYGNFQDKHTPPSNLDYNVNASAKNLFSLKNGSVEVVTGASDADTITYTAVTGFVFTGSFVSSNDINTIIPPGTLVNSFDPAALTMTFSNNVTVAAGDILLFLPNSDVEYNTTTIEYPNHSLKENRNYQVGVVLSDKFGRQSSVILSNSAASAIVDGQEYIGSTIYSPYRTAGVNPAEWPGDSLKVLFNSPIYPLNPSPVTGWPGVYNDDVSSVNYNPLGWYSFKIVVKQTEQEYYNVYLPGVMSAYPENNTLELGKTSHTVLFNDNINKVPRDLNEVGPLQTLFRSSVELFGRVENLDDQVGTGDINTQYYPGRVSDVVSSIANMNDLFGLNPTAPEYPLPGYQEFYLYESNPLIGRISTTSVFGVSSTILTAQVDIATPPPPSTSIVIKNLSSTEIPQIGDTISGIDVTPDALVTAYNAITFTVTVNVAQTLTENTLLTFSPPVVPITLQNLAVFETSPVESLLDIFWETSTSGLVSNLNTAVLDQSLGGATLVNFSTPNFREDAPIGTIINGAPIYLSNNFGAQVLQADIVDFSIVSVVDGDGIDRSSDFELDLSLNDGTYNIKTASLFWYGEDQPPRTFTFTISSQTTDGTVSIFVEIENLINVVPNIINCPPSTIVTDISDVMVTQIRGENGSAYFDNPGLTPATKNLAGQDLTWEIIQYNQSAPGVPLTGGFEVFTITPYTPQPNTDEEAYIDITKNTTSAGNYTIEILLKDASGLVGAGVGSLVDSCTFQVEIEAPCVNGRETFWLTGDPGDVIDATARFNSVIDPTPLGSQEIIIDSINFPNPTAKIWGLTQVCDINDTTQTLQGAGKGGSSGMSVYLDGAWVYAGAVKSYIAGGGQTAVIIQRDVFSQGLPAFDFTTVPSGAPMRFFTGKKVIEYVNHVGTTCGFTANYGCIMRMVYVFVNTPPNFGAQVIQPVNDLSFRLCYAQPANSSLFGPGQSGCYQPICPVPVAGNYPYVKLGFQPIGPNFQGNSCGNGSDVSGICN